MRILTKMCRSSDANNSTVAFKHAIAITVVKTAALNSKLTLLVGRLMLHMQGHKTVHFFFRTKHDWASCVTTFHSEKHEYTNDLIRRRYIGYTEP